MEYKKELMKLADKYLGDMQNHPGFIMQNGWNTIRPGDIYIIGFNPGKPKDSKTSRSIRQSILETEESYSAFLDEDWWGNGNGKTPHQERVTQITHEFGKSIRDVFATNALFPCSVDAQSLAAKENIWTLWEKCLPIHQYLLSIVRPKVILCLGNGDGISSFRLLRYDYSTNTNFPYSYCFNDQKFQNGKIARATINLSQFGEPLTTVLLGAPHPSRYPVTSHFKSFVSEQTQKNWVLP